MVVAALALVLAAPAPARADFIFISSRSALGGNDSINWGTLGPTGTVVTQYNPSLLPPGSFDPFSVQSSGGLNVSAHLNDPGGSYPGYTQATIGALSGSPSLQASGLDPSSTVATDVYVSLTFSQPVVGFGADMHFDSFTADGFIVVRLYDVNGNQFSPYYNTPLTYPYTSFTGFIGLLNNAGTPVISRADIEFIAQPYYAGSNVLNAAINQVDLVTGAPPSPAPEPATLVLLSIGGVAFAGYGWRRAR
jgi:hypothetical protein